MIIIRVLRTCSNNTGIGDTRSHVIISVTFVTAYEYAVQAINRRLATSTVLVRTSTEYEQVSPVICKLYCNCTVVLKYEGARVAHTRTLRTNISLNNEYE